MPYRLTDAPPLPHARHVERWQRRGLYLVLALLVSGLPWLVLHYTLGAGADELPHPAEAWLMRLHGLASFGALFMLGVMAGAHVQRGWRMSTRPRWSGQRRTGLALATLAALLALSAYLLGYLAPPAWHDPLGIVHAALGIGLAAVLLRHRQRRPRH